MRFGRLAPHSPTPVSLETAALAWIPVVLGMILGTGARLVVFLAGGGETPAATASVLCVVLGALLAVVWLRSSSQEFNWLGVLKVSAVWLLLSLVFRAGWIGIAVGGGWAGVKGDYSVGGGQPWPIILAVVGFAPLFLERSKREAE